MMLWGILVCHTYRKRKRKNIEPTRGRKSPKRYAARMKMIRIEDGLKLSVA